MSIDQFLLTDLKEALDKEFLAKQHYESYLLKFKDKRLKEKIAKILGQEKQHIDKIEKIIKYVKSKG